MGSEIYATDLYAYSYRVSGTVSVVNFDMRKWEFSYLILSSHLFWFC